PGAGRLCACLRHLYTYAGPALHLHPCNSVGSRFVAGVADYSCGRRASPVPQFADDPRSGRYPRAGHADDCGGGDSAAGQRRFRAPHAPVVGRFPSGDVHILDASLSRALPQGHGPVAAAHCAGGVAQLYSRCGKGAILMRRAVAVAGVVLAALTALRAAAQDLHVGWIEKIDCPAEWRANVRAQPKKLPKAGPRRFLYPGEGVRCVGPGKMLVQDHAELVSLAERGKWHNLRREGIGASKADEEVVERFGRVAGRSRGLGGPIFSPVNEGVVHLAGLVVRWTPTVTPGPIRLRLIDDEGNELWRVEGIQGSAGLFRSESLRRVLGQQRDAKYAGQFTLSLAHVGSAEPPVTFSLLSAGEE